MRLHKVRLSRPLARVERELNKIVAAINENRMAQAPGYRLHRTADGTKLDGLAQQRIVEAGTPGVLTRYQITSVSGDYVEARRQQEDGSVDPMETPEVIAKPHFLRVSVLNGLTVDGWGISITSPGNVRTLTAQAGAGVSVGRIVTQRMNYPYGVGNVIYATKVIGKTSVLHPTRPDEHVEWMDANVDARNFHQIRIELNACVLVGGQPTTKVIVFEAGPVP